jgi:hypothetical protein
MKHIKEHSEFLEEGAKAELNWKIKDLKLKYKETKVKIKETKAKVRDEKDRTKQELATLTLQKLAAKMEMLELDVQINKIKRTML